LDMQDDRQPELVGARLTKNYFDTQGLKGNNCLSEGAGNDVTKKGGSPKGGRVASQTIGRLQRGEKKGI